MSETKLLKTDSPSKDGEPVPKKTNQILAWLSDNRWYLAAAFVVLMMARSEAKRAETPAMRQNRQAIEEMSRGERDRLRHNQQQFEKLTRQDVQRVKLIHDAAQDDQQLDNTISQFHSWLATLSFAEHEELLATANVEDRLQIVRRLQAKVESPHPGNNLRPTMNIASRNQFSNLRVPLHDYERMMRAAAEWAELPSTPESKTPLGMLEYHASVLAEIMDKVLPSWRTAVSRTGNRPRPMFPDELRKLLVEKMSDPNMKRAIQSKHPTTQNMMAMMLLARGLFDETRQVAISLKPTDEELDRVFQNLPENRRKAIGEMPKELGDRYLQQMWVTKRLPADAGDSLTRLWTMFEKILNRSPNGQGNGTGPNRQRFDGGGFRSTGRPVGKER
ncbi:MAG: hypothetical protein ACKVII_20485 [Planctomycetales bacterium]